MEPMSTPDGGEKQRVPRVLPNPDICRTKPIGSINSFATCLVDEPSICPHVLNYGNGYHHQTSVDCLCSRSGRRRWHLLELMIFWSLVVFMGTYVTERCRTEKPDSPGNPPRADDAAAAVGTWSKPAYFYSHQCFWVEIRIIRCS